VQTLVYLVSPVNISPKDLREFIYPHLIDFLWTSHTHTVAVIQKQIRIFLNKMLCPKPMNYNVPRDIRYLKLPYYGHTSFVLRKELQKLLNHHFPQISFRMIFTNSRTIRSFFSDKRLCSKTSMLKRSLLIQVF